MKLGRAATYEVHEARGFGKLRRSFSKPDVSGPSGHWSTERRLSGLIQLNARIGLESLVKIPGYGGAKEPWCVDRNAMYQRAGEVRGDPRNQTKTKTELHGGTFVG